MYKYYKTTIVLIRLSNTTRSSVCIFTGSEFKSKLCGLKLIKIKYFNNLTIFIEICNYLYQKLTHNSVVLPKYI